MLRNPFICDRAKQVDSRLQRIDAEFTAARTATLKSKVAFEDVKKKRLDLFMKAFETASNVVDGIYKVKFIIKTTNNFCNDVF